MMPARPLAGAIAVAGAPLLSAACSTSAIGVTPAPNIGARANSRRRQSLGLLRRTTAARSEPVPG